MILRLVRDVLFFYIMHSIDRFSVPHGQAIDGEAIVGSGENEHRTSSTSMTSTRPPTVDCRGGKADNACSTICRTRIETKAEGRYALVNRPLNAPQSGNNPQFVGTGDLEGIVMGQVGKAGTEPQGEDSRRDRGEPDQCCPSVLFQRRKAQVRTQALAG